MRGVDTYVGERDRQPEREREQDVLAFKIERPSYYNERPIDPFGFDDDDDGRSSTRAHKHFRLKSRAAQDRQESVSTTYYEAGDVGGGGEEAAAAAND